MHSSRRSAPADAGAGDVESIHSRRYIDQPRNANAKQIKHQTESPTPGWGGSKVLCAINARPRANSDRHGKGVELNIVKAVISGFNSKFPRAVLSNRLRFLFKGMLNTFPVPGAKQRFDIIKHAGFAQRILVWIVDSRHSSFFSVWLLLSSFLLSSYCFLAITMILSPQRMGRKTKPVIA